MIHNEKSVKTIHSQDNFRTIKVLENVITDWAPI